MEITPLHQAEAQAIPRDAGRLQDAALQFEALLLSQILKSARESSPETWLGTEEDPSGATALEVAEEYFAQALAAQGGLGFAKMVVSQLQAGSTGSSSADGTPRPSHSPDPRLAGPRSM